MNRDRKYAMAAVAGVFLLFVSVGGIFANCRGVFFNPVSTSLGVSLSQLNLSGILSGIGSAATMPLFCKIYHKPYGRMFLSIISLLFCAAQYLLGYTTTLSWFYMVSLIQGITSGFINAYVIQAVVTSWYPSKKGTVLGFVSLAPSLAGTVMNPVITGWIEAYGWRTAYRMTGITVTVFIGIALLILRQEPESVNCKPIAGSASPRAAAADPTHSTLLQALLAALCVCVIATLNALAQHLANFAVVIGKGAAFGATLVSCAMIGSVIAKAVMGPVNDRFGARATTFVSCVLVIIACLGLMLTSASWVMCICAALFGIILSLSALEVPLICRCSMTPEQYLRYFPRISSLNILLDYSSAGILSFLLGINNTYTPVLLFTVGILVLCILSVVLLELLHRRQESGN